MTDTFSSEFGGLYDNPRLITTLRPVEPGTDGGVTWQGVAAGAAGAGIIAGIAALTQDISTVGSGVILLCGLVGMTVDSLLGATVEGSVVGNQGVNMLATLAAALTGAGVVLTAGLLRSGRLVPKTRFDSGHSTTRSMSRGRNSSASESMARRSC